ncbi:hypothetical protein A2U01_0089756, partial [Trifolium medium]|nr:hypothetical protein [Trifolium medium]
VYPTVSPIMAVE